MDSIVWYAASALTAIVSLVNIIIVMRATITSNKIITVRFLFYASALFVWSINCLIFASVTSATISYLASQVLHLGAIFIPVFLLHFILSYLDMKSRWVKIELMVYYAVAIYFLTIVFVYPDSMFLGVAPKKNFPFYFIPGQVYIYWIISFFWVGLSAHVKLFMAYARASGTLKKRLGFILFPNLISYSGCVAYFMPTYDIYIFPYPLGCFGSVVLSSVLTYAIVKQQILDVDVIVKRTVVFAGLFASVYGIISLFSILGQQLFESFLGWNSWVAMIPSILLITIVYRPLDELLTEITEKHLFQKRYDYRDLIRLFTTEVLTILDLKTVTDNTVKALDNIIKLESCSVYLAHPENDSYLLSAHIGIEGSPKQIDLQHRIIEHMYENKVQVLKKEDRLADEVRQTMTQMNANVCLPVKLGGALLGFIVLGDKKSGASFTSEEIGILLSLARTEAIAVSNAQLFEQLSAAQAEAAQSEKMAVIGTLAAGINHEICNPLGIIRGQSEVFMLNYKEGLYKHMSEEEIVEQSMKVFQKIIKETDRATGITKRLANFAKPGKAFMLDAVNIKKEVGEVMEILAHEMKVENIKLSNNIDERCPLISVDRKQIQEVLFNIIRNAAQAIEGKGVITITSKTSNGNVTVFISDTGPGIPNEKISKIFNPFFTTKDPGKGTGLGLYIVKQIVERNGGTIGVESTLGAGTTFKLTFRCALEEKKG